MTCDNMTNLHNERIEINRKPSNSKKYYDVWTQLLL
jgi:hypothetical protein